MFVYKSDNPKRFTLGIVYAPDEVDAHNDWMDAATIERACWDFNTRLQGRDPLAKSVLKFRADLGPEAVLPAGAIVKGALGIQHQAWDDGFGLIVESYVAPTDFRLGGRDIKRGTWMMGTIWSPSIWEKIQAGEITGYSLGGWAGKENDVAPTDPSPAVKASFQQARIVKAGAGAMLAFFLPPDLSGALAIEGGEPAADLHLTLAYLGLLDEINMAAIEVSRQAIANFCSDCGPIRGEIGGFGRFSASETSAGKDVLYASFDSPDLPLFREWVVWHCEQAGVRVAKQHGFTPHITLAYLDLGAATPISRVRRAEVVFDTLTLATGPARQGIQLGHRESLLEV